MDRRFLGYYCFFQYTCISDPSGIMTQLSRLSKQTAEQVVEQTGRIMLTVHKTLMSAQNCEFGWSTLFKLSLESPVTRIYM